ncbi:MAG TPA: tyrosine-protein phosphatase [Stellaceae bacterium]|nr:tyrosine-protein phosphatase [Stellaceae bacterium]
MLRLETGQNFRDLGGYPAADGGRTRWRRLFRSGSMSRIAGADIDRLTALEIRTICDLRTNGERSRHPTAWCASSATAIWHRDHERSSGAIAPLLAQSDLTADGVRTVMQDAYRSMPFEQAPSYRELFLQVAAGRLPLVFHCSAGKDRTGIAAALLLTAIGVPRHVVEEDYLMTNETTATLVQFVESDPRYGPFLRAWGDTAKPLLRAEPDYLSAMFEAVETRHGSVEAYLREALELPEQTVPAIRAALLE